MTPKGQGVIRGRCDLLYDSEGHSDILVVLTQFMTPKGQWVSRGRRDLLYDPKGQGDICGWLDLVYDP